MRSTNLLSLGLAGLLGLAGVGLASCGGKSKQAVETPEGGEGGGGDDSPKPSKPDDHQEAIQRVKDLKAEADKDPLLAPWAGSYQGVPPWDKLDVNAFPKGFEKGIELFRAEMAAITTDPAAPTFKNTFIPLQDSGRHLDRVQTLFGVMTSNLSTPEVETVDRDWSPKLAEIYDDMYFDTKLFARLQAIYQARESAGLDADQRRLVELTYDRFVQHGSRLTAEQKEKVGEINKQLAELFSDFGTKVLHDEDSWVVLESDADLAGLPASLVATYKRAADERADKDPKLAGKWAVVNTRSSVDPFLTSSARRDLREKVWKAFKNRGDNGGANDTNETIARIVALRAERAKLLGYQTHAHYRMADTMAKDPAKARELMMRVWPAAVARVKEEVAEMLTVAKKDKVKTIEPWDYLYYAEKVRKKKYALDQDELKAYFELNNMIQGAFWMAEKLYGLTFTEITGKVPAFHADVRVWEVKDETGATLGLFYGDYFARKGKRSGAWAQGYRVREAMSGTVVMPLMSNNNNFMRGGAEEPVLISLDDAETLFHEFGHALHGLLSTVTYPGLDNTPRDFVEYPSQVHEMWVLSRPVLDKFALHHKTKKPMPQKLLDKVEASRRFNQGYATVEYLSSALVDMEIHTTNEPIDADAFERAAMAKIGAPREVAMRHRLPQFNHLFTGDGYSAGYYSYLWSEVMDADTRKAFEEAGDVFDPTTAGKMRKYILAPGNSTDRADAYRQFRGRDPDVKALLEKRGFPTGP
jgi:peptidyl-dipeptidase Dcp